MDGTVSFDGLALGSYQVRARGAVDGNVGEFGPWIDFDIVAAGETETVDVPLK